MQTESVFSKIADDLDFEGAVRRGSERNDLLPPRLEDGVLGEVGKRFSETLKTKLVRGRYEPIRAEIVLVPKPGNTTRPAALLNLPDRVIFDAIVEKLRSRIETSLLGPEIVYWPRGKVSAKRWDKFEAAPIDADKAFVALADITGFYESIDHERLRDVLISMTGRREHVDALIEFLHRVMRSARGLPQGLAPSDPIATAFLSPVDAAMARAGLDYARHGDDIRVAASSGSEAREALYVFEQELRRIGLLINSSKSMIMRRSAYKASIARAEGVHERARDDLLAARIAEAQDDPDTLQEVLEEAGEEQLGWDLFYHRTISVDDVIDQVKDHLSPDDITVALKVLREALGKAPGSADGLSREEFHLRVSSALIRLAAGKSPLAIQLVPDLLARFPEKAELIATYLLAQNKKHARSVSREAIKMLREDRFQTEWEQAWLLRVARKFANDLSNSEAKAIREIATNESKSAFCRVEAIQVLAARGELSQSLTKRLWNSAPTCYQPDLIAAAHSAAGGEAWCKTFLAGVVDDPVHRVVVRQLEASQKKK